MNSILASDDSSGGKSRGSSVAAVSPPGPVDSSGDQSNPKGKGKGKGKKKGGKNAASARAAVPPAPTSLTD